MQRQRLSMSVYEAIIGALASVALVIISRIVAMMVFSTRDVTGVEAWLGIMLIVATIALALFCLRRIFEAIETRRSPKFTNPEASAAYKAAAKLRQAAEGV